MIWCFYDPICRTSSPSVYASVYRVPPHLIILLFIIPIHYLLYSCARSFFSICVYLYISSLFPQFFYNSVVGLLPHLLCLCTSSFFSILLYLWCIVHLHYLFIPPCIVLLHLIITLFIVIFHLFILLCIVLDTRCCDGDCDYLPQPIVRIFYAAKVYIIIIHYNSRIGIHRYRRKAKQDTSPGVHPSHGLLRDPFSSPMTGKSV